MSLGNIENHLTQLRPTVNCISSQIYFSCQSNPNLAPMELKCFSSLLAKNFDDSQCFSEPVNKPLSVSYAKNGALIRSENGAKVRELTTGKTIFQSSSDFCFFLKDGKRLRVETPNDVHASCKEICFDVFQRDVKRNASYIGRHREVGASP